MFAMLSGRWPRVTADGVDLDELPGPGLEAAVERLVREVLDAQRAAGLELLTDGGVRWPDASAAVLDAFAEGGTGADGLLVRSWRSTAAVAEGAGAVAQVVPGPWTLAAEPAPGDDVAARAIELAGRLASELAALEAAGCPVVVVEERAPLLPASTDPAGAAAFAEAHRVLLSAASGTHAMLALTGGSAVGAGPGAIFAAPYRSHAFDLIEGPDNWSLVRAAPPGRGIVCGALDTRPGATGEDQVPLLVWAARYAASAGGRGLDRVGLTNGTSMGLLDPGAGRAALEQLARAASLAAMPLPEAVEAGLDPRTVGSRMAALGPSAPRPARRGRGRSAG